MARHRLSSPQDIDVAQKVDHRSDLPYKLLAIVKSFVSDPLYTQTLRRASEIVGGINELGMKLGVSAFDIERWLLGQAAIPPDVFLRAVDIVSAQGIEISSRRIKIDVPGAGDKPH